MNHLYIPKLQWCNRWSLGMDNESHFTVCNHLSMLRLKLIRVSKEVPSRCKKTKRQETSSVYGIIRCLQWKGQYTSIYSAINMWDALRIARLVEFVHSSLELIAYVVHGACLQIRVYSCWCIIYYLVDPDEHSSIKQQRHVNIRASQQ